MKVETVEVTRPDGETIVVNADEAAEYEAAAEEKKPSPPKRGKK